MDIATKLFSLTLGVEPNKATLKDFSEILNSAVLSLSEKQKALDQYAKTAQNQTYVAQQQPPQAKLPPAKQRKAPVIWQIPQAKMNELQWHRAQLMQMQRAKAAREKTAKAKAKSPAPKLSQPKRAPPKLGPKQPQNGQAKTTPTPKPKPTPPKTPKPPAAPKAPVEPNNSKPKPKPKAPSTTSSKPTTSTATGSKTSAAKTPAPK